MAIVKAEAVFNAGAGFSADELARIGAAGAGKTVSFPRGTLTDTDGHGRTRTEGMLSEYARGKTADELAGTCGMSRRQVFYELRKERGRGFSCSRIREWKGKGLSWRELGRLYGRSHEAVRQAVGEPAEEVEGSKLQVTGDGQEARTGMDQGTGLG